MCWHMLHVREVYTTTHTVVFTWVIEIIAVGNKHLVSEKFFIFFMVWEGTQQAIVNDANSNSVRKANNCYSTEW